MGKVGAIYPGTDWFCVYDAGSLGLLSPHWSVVCDRPRLPEQSVRFNQ
jgi:hypothetical protein